MVGQGGSRGSGGMEMLIRDVGTGYTGTGGAAAQPVWKAGEKSGFASALEAAGSANRTRQGAVAGSDTMKLQQEGRVSWDYQEKLDRLSKLNEETDWSSMTDAEKVRTFEDRYRETFGRACFTGLYTLISKPEKMVYESFLSDIDKYFHKGGKAELKTRYHECYREAYYGTLSDSEVRAAIRERYKENGSMESKYIILDEYRRAGVGTDADGKMRYGIAAQIFTKVEKTHWMSMYGTGKTISQHPNFSNWYMSYAKGIGEGTMYSPNWAQIAQGVMDGYRSGGSDPAHKMTEGELQKLQEELDEFLNEVWGDYV